ncbi:MAG: DUF1559 domain-containing protein, partial [Gemmataceae bacterium]
TLALHGFHDTRARFPALCQGNPSGYDSTWKSLFSEILPFVEHTAVDEKSSGSSCNTFTRHANVLIFRCPTDPTAPDGVFDANWTASSYAASFQVFGNPDAGDNTGNMDGAMTLTGIADGTSNTVVFAEKYQKCGKAYLNPGDRTPYGSLWQHNNLYLGFMSTFAVGNRTGTTGYSAQGGSGTTPYVGRVGPSAKFQSAPNPYFTACDVTLAQSGHPGVMQVALADGSVRTISTSVSGATWWQALTPRNEEVLGPDW